MPNQKNEQASEFGAVFAQLNLPEAQVTVQLVKQMEPQMRAVDEVARLADAEDARGLPIATFFSD